MIRLWKNGVLANSKVIYQNLKADVIRNISLVDDDKLETLFECFGWEPIKDEDRVIKAKETVGAKIALLEDTHGEQVSMMTELNYVAEMISEYFDGWCEWDQDKVEEFERKNTGIDIRSIITELEQEAGKPIVSFNN